MKLVDRNIIVPGLLVMDEEGKTGKVVECPDLHNVHVLFDGEGLTVKLHGKDVECGGSGIYCFVPGCVENSEAIDPLYIK